MKRTKAVVVEPRRIELMDEELPALGPHDVLLKMISVGMCHTDLPGFLGKAVSDSHVSEKYGYMRSGGKPKYPLLLGHEPVCRVLDVGSEVTAYTPGEIVTGFVPGSFSTHAVVSDEITSLVKPPESDKPYKYCLGEPLGCIVNIVREAACKFGDNIAVVGCGFMGLLTIAGLKNSGAKELVAIDLLDSKLAQAKKFGATSVVNPRDCMVDDAAYELTGGKFFDVVVEITGSLRGLDTACSIIKASHKYGMEVLDGSFQEHGKLLIPSVYGREEVFPLSLAYNLVAKTPLMLVTHPGFSPRMKNNIVIGLEARENGTLPIDQLITHEIPFADTQKAFEMLENPPEDYIKGVVVFE